MSRLRRFVAVLLVALALVLVGRAFRGNPIPAPSQAVGPTPRGSTDHGQRFAPTTAPVCDVTLTWDAPPEPGPSYLSIPGAEDIPIATGRAELQLPCGLLTISARARYDEPEAAFQLVDDQLDTRLPSTHLTWTEREGLLICVENDAGQRLVDATVTGGWPVEDCWGAEEPYWGPISVSAPGYLDAELWPEMAGVWLWPSYEVVMERGIKVHYDCVHEDGTRGCVGKEVHWAECVSTQTPDAGPCDKETQTCLCPDADDARVVCTLGRYAGERATPDESGEALFAHTGTASLTVAGTEYCEAILTRHEEAAWVIVGKLKCEGGNAVWRKLVPGSYGVMGTMDPSVQWDGISLSDGEQKVVALTLPLGQPLAIEWVGETTTKERVQFVIAELPGVWVSWQNDPAPPVPAGAELWTCSGDGCCHYPTAPERVVCDPDPDVRPPYPEM